MEGIDERDCKRRQILSVTRGRGFVTKEANADGVAAAATAAAVVAVDAAVGVWLEGAGCR